MVNHNMSIWTIYVFNNRDEAAIFAAANHTYFTQFGERYEVTICN